MSRRDYGPETKAIIKAIYEAVHGVGPVAEDRYQIGRWTMERIDKTSFYKVTIAAQPPAQPAIAMTGADVVTQLHIPFPHRWTRIHFYHTTAALVVSQEFLRVTVRRALGTMFPNAFTDDLFCEFEINAVMMIEAFGEGFEYEASTYNVILNTVATDLIFPVFYIQKLER